MAQNLKDLLAAAQDEQRQSNAPYIQGNSPNIMGVNLNDLAKLIQQTSTPVSGFNEIPQNLATMYQQNRQGNQQNAFASVISQIHADPKMDLNTKIAQINSAISAFGQNPADYKDVLDNYAKMSNDAMSNAVTMRGQDMTAQNNRREMANKTYLERMKQQTDGGLTPGEKRLKNLDTTKAISSFNQNEVQRGLIADAKLASKNVWTGLGGKTRQSWSGMFNPNDPMLGEWQKIKMVLTDAQLLNTAQTKGAISDREMELFAKAAANDDFNSIPKIMPVLAKLERFMAAEEKSMRESYRINYGDDLPGGGGIGQTKSGLKYKVVQ